MKTSHNPENCAVYEFTGHHDYELLLLPWSLFHPLRFKRNIKFFQNLKGKRCFFSCKFCKHILVNDY